MATRGVIYVHSAPAAICPHVEWAISGVLGTRVSLAWTGETGTGSKLAAALKNWSMVRFEITEEASSGVDGQRYCHVPGRGIWHATMSANGDVLVGEDQLRALAARATSLDGLQHALAQAIGIDVDAELESFRRAGEGSPVTWLHQVG